MTSFRPRGWRRFRSSVRASVAVETALALPIVLAIGALCADIYTVGLERERMEQRAGAIVSILGMQRELTQEGLQGLLDAVLPEEGLGNYQLLISNVRQTGELYWQLDRGNSDQLCTANQAGYGEHYPGDLPEKDQETGSENISMVVVELCREGKDISLAGGLSLSNLLNVTMVNRTGDGVIALDSALGQEAGQPKEEYEDNEG
ncbi:MULTISPECIES: TadE/TadG family type IV pilus assembly protein [unclassified Brenneria]|uniref:TadE/TadG family type IV pilus assembly protein n=1 Tax=unclassified Brenneria TaxID=2634434 RepID=UPI0015564798|nr:MULTISPECIES: hypothetical protein [unclassified Brenneria]MBJ7222687.1 hypothetical protein [Brenneria sp. L3-3C-1]MEE3643930.1 hypothetical protein [Brenneria sp. L3_3C_1]MEE3651117.1 hypothetical protein [Brenneria sp. HEZEL_4_2_4]NPD01072.1 hypothetical protein [Brenneria sp. hezel4-2-4]